ncbi:helix-turn-helix transcriptional regulator [Streptomyces zingiberis]|uniref:Helix-turn-helix domain-containing protein n=1 Tax=Streptomyces zingiberis TaxID=2053010 RepID=A0ABX1BR95_9ACTN|nr:helix-turn-helix transcriptional regulator [Streptomyces zingiberis]NJQ00211.1 helix-turn-helix domain-containing protein [Streptomyces zingiberis]
MESSALAHFLRARRESLQPEDLGLPRGERRRTAGLRREEVAATVGMSTDYYSRLERGDGHQPSEQMLAALARGLRLSLAERDHLFQMAGYGKPQRMARTDHVDAGLMRIVDRLVDTPATVVNALGETLLQTPLGTALLGDQTRFQGLSRSSIYRWFTDPDEQRVYRPRDRDRHARILVSHLRHELTHGLRRSRAAEIVQALTGNSSDFDRLWQEHPVGWRYSEQKILVHPEVGELHLHCQTLLDPEQTQTLLVFTAAPGSESHDKLQLLAVIGAQKLNTPSRQNL